MRTLVVFYSRSGHTQQVAREIAARCGADLEPIHESRSRRGLWGYLRSSWEALIHAAPPISPSIKDPGRYDLVVIGTPIWNFGLAAPVRAYAQRYSDRFKRVAFFCTEGGSGDARAFAELSRICGQEPVATFALTERQLPKPAHTGPLSEFLEHLPSA
jgi:flavodoxin